MSAPPPALPASISTSGYQDGLGRRSLAFDRESGSVLERLVVRPELVAFERSLRERADRLASFDDERIARVREIEHDRDAHTLTVVSEFVGGRRLSDLVDEIALGGLDENAAPSIDQALGLLLQLLPALSALHTTARITHGVLGAGRIAVSTAGEIVLLDAIYGPSIERLQLSRRRLWAELRVAPPPSAGASRFDVTADIGQAALAAAALTVGRPLGDRDYPDGLRTLLSDMTEIAQLRGSARFATALQRFFERALPLPASRVYASADEANAAVQELVTAEMGVSRCREALTALVRDTPPAAIELPSVPVAVPPAPAAFHAPAPPPEPIAIQPEPIVVQPDPIVVASAPILPEPVAIAPESAALVEEPVVETPEPFAFTAEPAVVAAPVIADPEPAFESEPVRDAIEDFQPTAPVPEPEAQPVAPPSTASPVAEPQTDSDRDWSEFTAPSPVVAQIAPAESPIVEEPSPAPATIQSVTSAPPATASAAPPAAPQAAEPRKGGKHKRSKRGRRDRVAPQSPPAAKPPAAVVPAAPARVDPPMQMPVLTPAPRMPVYDSGPQTVWAAPAPVPLAPIAAAPVAVAAPTPVRVKLAAPNGYVPPVSPRAHAGTFDDISAHHAVISYPESRSRSTLTWKLVAAAAIVIALGVTVGRASLLDRSHAPAATLASKVDPVVVPTEEAPSGSIAIETQPDGVRVLIDGKPAGESPLKVDGVAPGSHIVTLITSSATLKRSVKVEAGKTSSVDVPVFSGWLALFSPILLEVGENGRSLGTTEHGRLMLPPGRHTLTFTNKELGYSLVKKVDIDSGEERALTLEPRGTISLNAVPWAEVYIDGQRAGETPMANFQVPLGTREILFKHPQLGERRVTEIVKATGPSTVSVDFTK